MEELSLSYPWLPEGDTHSVACCLCDGSAPTESVFTFALNGAHFSIERCTKDDLMYLAPQPGEQYAEALYNHPSYFAVPNDMYGHAVDAEKGRHTGNIRVKEMETHGGRPATVLEIGCGLGYTLEAMREAGITATGVEFSDASVAACRARGLTVYHATLDNVIPSEAADSYDAIALYSVLEHVPNPKQFLAQVVEHLAPEGRLIIRVPRMSPQGPWLSLLDHFWHFTSASLHTLLKLEGLSILAEFNSGTFVAPSGGTLDSMTIVATGSPSPL